MTAVSSDINVFTEPEDEAGGFFVERQEEEEEESVGGGGGGKAKAMPRWSGMFLPQ